MPTAKDAIAHAEKNVGGVFKVGNKQWAFNVWDADCKAWRLSNPCTYDAARVHCMQAKLATALEFLGWDSFDADCESHQFSGDWKRRVRNETLPFKQGKQARYGEHALTANPYTTQPKRSQWLAGWETAESEINPT